MNKKINKKSMVIVLIALLMLVGISIVFAVMNAASDVNVFTSPTPSLEHADDGILDGEIPVGNYEETLEALKKKVDAAKFEVKINSSISKDSVTGQFNALIGNTARNRYDCYVEIESRPEGVLLYRSPIIKPGQYIPNISIQPPKSGEADAAANFIIVSPDTGSIIGKVVVALKIIS